MNNIHLFGIAIAQYRTTHGQWPNGLEDLAPFVEDMKSFMENPVTGDNPGYEYLKPTDENPPPDTEVIYQLRDGQRDMALERGRADGSVR